MLAAQYLLKTFWISPCKCDICGSFVDCGSRLSKVLVQQCNTIILSHLFCARKLIKDPSTKLYDLEESEIVHEGFFRSPFCTLLLNTFKLGERQKDSVGGVALLALTNQASMHRELRGLLWAVRIVMLLKVRPKLKVSSKPEACRTQP